MKHMRENQKPYLYLFLLCAVAYAIIVPLHWSRGYIDLGDGNYLYISWRMTQGLTLYRDIMAPQPPVHLFLGATLVRFAQATGLSDLYTIRAYSYLLHLFTAFILYLLGLRIFQRKDTASIAACIYLFIPEGFWWSLGYQSEPTEILFLLCAVYFFFDDKPLSFVVSALFSTLAVFTNMTAAPYVAFIAFYSIARRARLWKYYIVPLIVLGALGALVAESLTGAYLSNVIFNQVGTFPRKEIGGETSLEYALRKIPAEAKDVFVWEGGLIILAALGLLAYLRASTHRFKEFIGWFAFFSWCSIIYVSKGGTMDYIFTLGEPYVALFASFFLCWFAGTLRHKHQPNESEQRLRLDTTPILRIVVIFAGAIITVGIGITFIVATLQQKTYEMPVSDVRKVEYYINKYTEPGDTILSPPYFAFLTKRPLIEEYSEVYIWMIKYWNERILDQKPGEGVLKVERIADAMKNHRLPLVILDMRVTGTIPEIRKAVGDYYTPILEKPMQTLNTQYQFFVPRKSEQ